MKIHMEGLARECSRGRITIKWHPSDERCLLSFEYDFRVAFASTIVPERGIPLMRDESGIPEGWLLLKGIPPKGFTGADLLNLMNEAAIIAAHRDLKEISKDEISDALERIIAGPEKKNAVVPEEKRLVAYHGKCCQIISRSYNSSWC